MLNKALGGIASQVKVEQGKGTPVVVFNDLSWSRSGSVELALPVAMTAPVHVVDANGQEVACQLTALGKPEEVNVAAAAAGATACASSVLSQDYGAERAIDGHWSVGDPNPEVGASEKWNSAGAGPHTLTVDFGQARTIHKVVLWHQGVLGRLNEESKHNTVDFQLQGADAVEGPWTDLVAPVSGNTASLTTHTFAPTRLRYLRLTVTKGAQVDSYARIFEIQAFAKAGSKADKLLFAATDVPALGYKTYYIASGASKNPTKAVTGTENAFYRVELVPGGIKSIFDKKQNRELLDTGKFLGGEVFTMLSVAENNRGDGTDAGEFGRVPLPVMDASFDRVATYKPEWKLLESGPVRTVYGLEQPMKNVTVRQRMVLWHQLGQLDCEVDLKEFNGEFWREFRMALPLALNKPQIAYEVPMGVVEIGKDEIPTTGGHAYGGVVYDQQCRDIKPRAVQNFVDASDALGGLTMSTSVSVFDWQDPTDEANKATLLQPVLLASRKSCHGKGVWYPQAGDHTYRFSLTSHAGDWRKGRKSGIQANHELFTVVGAIPAKKAKLPAEQSFFSVSADNVIISTVKKCEDDDSVIVRAYEVDGRDTTMTVNLFCPAKAAERTNILEEEGKPWPLKKGGIEMPLGHHAIETIKFKLEK